MTIPTQVTIYGPVTIYPGRPQIPRWRWSVGPVTHKGETMPVELTLTTEQKARLRVEPETEGDNAATLDGPVTYTVTSGDCTLVPLEPPDPLSVYVYAGPTLGASTITATADAHMGPEVVLLSDLATVQVIAPQATSLGLAADEPELK